MGVQYCHNCERQIDLDVDVEHFDECCKELCQRCGNMFDEKEMKNDYCEDCYKEVEEK